MNSLFCIFVLYGITSMTIDPIIPLIHQKIKIGYDRIGISLLFGSFFLLISTFISGKLSDKFSAKKNIAVGLIFLFSGFLFFGISYKLYINYIILISIIILIRSGLGTIESSVHKYAPQISPDNINIVFLKLNIFWNIGATVGPVIISVVLLTELNLGYEFLFLSILFLLILIIFFWSSQEQKRFYYFRNEDRKESVRDNNKKSSFILVKNPTIILSGIILFFHMGSLAGLSSWMTTYFSILDIKVSTGSLILSLYWATSTIGLLLTHKFLKKTNEITLLLVGCILCVICITLFNFVLTIYMKIIFLIIQSISVSGFISLTKSIAVQENKKFTGIIVGFIMSMAVAGSMTFLPILGYVIEYVGEKYIIYIFSLSWTITLSLIIILYKLINKKYEIKLFDRCSFNRVIK